MTNGTPLTDTRTTALAERESILFIQPRYHTNQLPIVRTFQERGHDVSFLALRSIEGETYDTLEPDLVRYAPWFKFLYRLITDDEGGEAFHNTPDTNLHRFGVPSLPWLYRYFKSSDPDLVVAKGYNIITYLAIPLAKLFDFDVLFYDQDPVYGERDQSTSRRIANTLYFATHGTRLSRISPVLGDPDESQAFPPSYYVPFAAEPAEGGPDLRERNGDESVEIIMVGKFTARRKNHIPLLEVLNSLRADYDVSLTMVGSLSSESHPNFQRIQSYVEEHSLESVVDIHTNLAYDAVQELYSEADIYVLPSRNERAAVSHLEAMAHEIPVICSDTNGTNCYIERGANGFIFRTGDFNQLKHQLERLVSDADRRRTFGAQSYELVTKKYTGDMYYKRLSAVVSERF